MILIILSRVRRILTPWAAPVLLLVVYLAVGWSESVERGGPSRLMPMPDALLEALVWAVSNDPGLKAAPLGVDVAASLMRLGIGMGVALSLALALAMTMHFNAITRSVLFPSLVGFAKIPAIALLPLILLWFGIDETPRILLVVLGVGPAMTIHLLQRMDENHELVADGLEVIGIPATQKLVLITLPMLLPFLLREVQTQLGPAWLFLLVAETFGTNEGLGYRIFVFRRTLSIDRILVYAATITALSLFLYWLLGLISRRVAWRHV